MIPFEDTWLDIVLKAKRGLALDNKTLADQSAIPEEKLVSLLARHRNDATLVAIAPTLGLHPRELVMIAAGTSYQVPLSLPATMKQFTTSYHGMQVHSYLLWSEYNKKAVAFDTGTDITPLLNELHHHQLKLESIFLTHAHADHVNKLSELIEKTKAVAWIDPAELIEQAQPLPPAFLYQLDTTITMEARATPGHSPGGTSYFIQGLSSPVAIVGDSIFARSIGGIPPEAYHKGLKDICHHILLLPPSTILAPGHGPLTTVQEERDKNPFFA